MIAGFERPTAGEILLDGDDVAAVPPHERNVHTVFQNYALFPHLDVFDNVAFGLRRHKVAKAERARAGRARRSSWSSSSGLGAPAAAAALRRPAAAGRARPGARPAPGRAAARRAARRARREDPQAAAGRAEGAPGGGRDHLRVRDPRPGGGAQHERPDRGDERRAGSSRSARPSEVYEDPATVFVADFLGVSNLMDAEADRRGAPASARSGSASSRCAPAAATSAARGAGQDRRPARAARACSPRRRREPRELPAGDGRAHGLRRLEPAGDRPARDRRRDAGVDREHRRRSRLLPRAPR